MEIQSGRPLDSPSERKDRGSLNASLNRKTLYALVLLHGSNIHPICLKGKYIFRTLGKLETELSIWVQATSYNVLLQ